MCNADPLFLTDDIILLFGILLVNLFIAWLIYQKGGKVFFIHVNPPPKLFVILQLVCDLD